MRIEGSTITLQGKSFIQETFKKEESLQYWDDSNKNGSENTGAQELLSSGLLEDKLEISEQAKALLEKERLSVQETTADEDSFYKLDEKDKHKIKLIEKFIEVLTGKKIKLVTLDKIKLNPEAVDRIIQRASDTRQGWGLNYNYTESYHEEQQMAFNASGTVKTSDGREIDLSLQLNVSRTFISEKHVSLKAGDAAIDPLIINFDAPSAHLSNTKTSFDIDADGKEDQISFVTGGSGFLALDKNNDGVINDGHELFGPQIGNGFNELSAYDMDGNNWIDENDPVFDKLRIWTSDESGNKQLLALGEKGIGAIYLGNTDTSYNIKDNSNNLQGQIRSTGIFLKEDGTAGTLQHVDLAI